MTVSFDQEACQGHGRCYEIAPDVFGDDDRGHAILLQAEVAGPAFERAVEAVRACPERAITVDGADA